MKAMGLGAMIDQMATCANEMLRADLVAKQQC
jgi:hypothetical protein